MKKELKSIYIEIISRCNEKCIYCYNNEIIDKTITMPLEKIKSIIDQSVLLGVHSIAISGGEPLLHPDIMEILSYTAEKNIPVTLITNCTLIDAERACLLADKKINIQVTVDSGIEKVHDTSRGKGTFNRQKEALKKLKAENFCGTFNLRCNIWKGNCDKGNMESVLDFARRFEITDVTFALAHPTSIFHNVIDTEPQINKLQIYMKELRDQNKDLKIDFQEEQTEWGCPLTTNEKTTNLDCGFRIAPDGKVFPCQNFEDEEFVIGNLMTETLQEIVDGEKFTDLLTLLNLRLKYIPACLNCVCRSICRAGCPAKAYRETKNIFSVSGDCGKRKKEYRDILNEALHFNI